MIVTEIDVIPAIVTVPGGPCRRYVPLPDHRTVDTTCNMCIYRPAIIVVVRSAVIMPAGVMGPHVVMRFMTAAVTATVIAMPVSLGI